MIVIKDDPSRVMWIDFDRAETYNEDTITDRQQGLLAEEEEIIRELKESLVSDGFPIHNSLIKISLSRQTAILASSKSPIYSIVELVVVVLFAVRVIDVLKSSE